MKDKAKKKIYKLENILVSLKYVINVLKATEKDADTTIKTVENAAKEFTIQ